MVLSGGLWHEELHLEELLRAQLCLPAKRYAEALTPSTGGGDFTGQGCLFDRSVKERGSRCRPVHSMLCICDLTWKERLYRCNHVEMRS